MKNLVLLLSAGACALVSFCSGGETTDFAKFLKAPVLKGSARSSYRIVQKEVDEADCAADRLWTSVENREQLTRLQKRLRDGMTAAVGGFPARTPLNAQVVRRRAHDGYAIEEVLFESHPNVHVPALLFLPDAAKFPGRRAGVIVTCGHSGNGKAAAGYQRMCVLLAKSGLVALIYDPFDQGERIQVKGLSNCNGHNAIGVNATLLGWSMARLRIWDGMRALDYLETRPEVDASRLGVCGQSGGGTMTSLIMAIEPRIRCAGPSCYLTTLRDVFAECGPQDAEQNLFGQLSFGLNHLGYVLLQAPNPVLCNFKTGDFFPFQGALETIRNARAVAGRFGWADRFQCVYGVGPHGWTEGNRTSTRDWMREHLQGEKGVWDATGDSYRALDLTFGTQRDDCGIPEKDVAVAPGGSVLNLPGERLVYDLFRDELARAGTARAPVTPEVVRAYAGIRADGRERLAPTKTESAAIAGGTVEKYAFLRADGLALPAVLLTPAERRGGAAILVSDDARASQSAKARELFAAGRTVLALDVIGTGEIAPSPHRFYGAKNPDEEVAVMLYTLGRSLVGERAENILEAARWLAGKDGGKVDLFADGRVAVAARHAHGAAPDLIGSVGVANAPSAWREVIRQGARYPFACAVFGALRAYDWTDL